MKGVLALTVDGNLTICTAPPNLRGKGRCNHIKHQEDGQTADEFINSISDFIKQDEYEEIDNNQLIENVIKTYINPQDPDWRSVIESIPNPFDIGKEGEEGYERAEMIDFTQEKIYDGINGNYIKLSAKYELRGEIFECDFGTVPAVNEDNTITIDGVDWRVLPVVEQRKAGLISYRDNITVKQIDGRNVAFSMSKDPESDLVSIYGQTVKIEDVENFLKTGDTSVFNSGQIWALTHIDPIVFERFPQLKNGDLRSLKELPADSPGDLSYRRCLRYQDIVKEEMRLQLRRMGVTFRSNIAKRKKKFDDPYDHSHDYEYPLFYQVNLSNNIKKKLISSSNVQFADNLNPIIALSQSEKISYTGPGGYYKDKVPYELRMPHKSHENIIDSMDVSSGKNVGLTGTLSHGYIGNDRFIHERKDSPSLSPSDFIPYKYNDDPNRAIMAVAHMKQACPIVGGEDPIVSTQGWDSIKGAKLGSNARIAYLPMDYVYEDSALISQSLADKMTTIKTLSVRAKNKEALDNIKVGQIYERKSDLAGNEINYRSVVKAVRGDIIDLEQVYKMNTGDKLAGRHGNKCTVSKVLPDNEMPKMLNPSTGKLEPVQIVMSPLSVSGRKNLGQIMESNEAFGCGNSIEAKQKVIMPDGHAVEASGGKQFIMRLNHLAEEKLASHADEISAKRESEGTRLGEMESILLSTDSDRLKILDYLRHQEAYDSHKKLHSFLKAIGVDMQGVNWDD